MKTTLKIVLIVMALLAVIVLAVAVFISPVAKDYIEKHDQELLGRSIRMDELKANIFTGRLRVNGLKIGGVDDSTTFFRVDSFDMRLRLLPLLRNRVNVPYMTFVSPDMKVYQDGSNFNFDGLLDRFFSDTTQVDTTSASWEIGIYNIAIHRGHIFYKDLQLNATWGMNDINLQIPGVYFSGEKTDVGAVLNFAEGGSLDTQVAYDMENDSFDIGMKIKDLTMPGTLPYFQQSLNVSHVDGRLTANVNLRGDIEHLMSVRAEGTASLAGFKLYDMQQRPVITADSLAINLTEGDLGRMSFHFDRIHLAGFSTFFELTPTSNNYLDLIKPSALETSTTVESSQAAASGPVLTVGSLEVSRSSITYHDRTLEKPFEYHISDIRMHSRNFNPSAHNNLTIDARMQKTGQAKLRWEGSIDDINNQNITLWLTNVALKDFTPFCEHYTAYPLIDGNLTFRSQNIIRNRYLDGTNHLDVFEPKVDKKRKELKPEMNIPLKLGLYVLKDKKGHVTMDLPVKGSLDSPEFSYRKIVLKAIGNVLLKVVSTPFSFLAGNKNNLEYIDIDPLQYVFSSEQYASFDKIAQMIQEKPEMHIALTQRIDFERAQPLQAANALRLAYANHLRAADTTAKLPQLSMLEFEKIQQTDIRTPAVTAFADSLLNLRGILPQGLSPLQKAQALYNNQAASQLTRMMSSRDKALAEYMRTTHNVATPALHLLPLDSTALRNYKGHHRYTISLEVDGETVEVNASDSTSTVAVPTSALVPASTTAKTTMETPAQVPTTTTSAAATPPAVPVSQTASATK